MLFVFQNFLADYFFFLFRFYLAVQRGLAVGSDKVGRTCGMIEVLLKGTASLDIWDYFTTFWQGLGLEKNCSYVFNYPLATAPPPSCHPPPHTHILDQLLNAVPSTGCV
jgi:hypothetical protein